MLQLNNQFGVEFNNMDRFWNRYDIARMIKFVLFLLKQVKIAKNLPLFKLMEPCIVNLLVHLFILLSPFTSFNYLAQHKTSSDEFDDNGAHILESFRVVILDCNLRFIQIILIC